MKKQWLAFVLQIRLADEPILNIIASRNSYQLCGHQWSWWPDPVVFRTMLCTDLHLRQNRLCARNYSLSHFNRFCPNLAPLLLHYQHMVVYVCICISTCRNFSRCRTCEFDFLSTIVLHWWCETSTIIVLSFYCYGCEFAIHLAIYMQLMKRVLPLT